MAPQRLVAAKEMNRNLKYISYRCEVSDLGMLAAQLTPKLGMWLSHASAIYVSYHHEDEQP
jgi:hypothetical protein